MILSWPLTVRIFSRSVVASSNAFRPADSWLESHGYDVVSIEPLAGDVSVRRYSRIRMADGASVILASYPPEIAEACSRFVRTDALLSSVGVRTPRILTADCAGGQMLLEDLGERTVYQLEEPTSDTLAALFQRAVEVIAALQTIDEAEVARLNPTLDAELLRRELTLTRKELLEPRRMTDGGALDAELSTALDRLCAALGAGAPVVCHRDFMVRNLVPLGDDLAVLDHQDLRLGPAFYDLASLLNDSLFLDPESERRLLASCLQSDSDRLAFHRAAAQRTLKAAGSYARFSNRGFATHEHLIAPTLRRCLRHLERLPETGSVCSRLRQAWEAVIGEPSARLEEADRPVTDEEL